MRGGFAPAAMAAFCAAVVTFSADLSSFRYRAEAASSCSPTFDGVPVDSADIGEVAWYGRALDQAFLARGSAIRSITVWMSPRTGFHDDIARLYICKAETLSTGEVRSMSRRGILLTGPLLHIPMSPQTPYPLVFELDPPFLLPHDGHFSFAIHDELDCFGAVPLMAVSGNPYPDGSLWRTGPTPSCEYGAYAGYPLVTPSDLCFQIEYCDEVDAVQATWGSVKARYR